MSEGLRGLRRAGTRRQQGRARRWSLIFCALAVVGGMVAGGMIAMAHSAGGVHLTAAGDPNPNCTIIVPHRPLTARGLATPYQLTATNPADGPCNEANDGQTAFVQGAIINQATGQISVYNPLVIDSGTTPAVAPTPPTLPRRAIVALWFGYNGDTLTLSDAAHGRTLWRNSCVSGLGHGQDFSSFTQVAYCNAVEFFRSANHNIARGRLTVPPVGTATDGLPCLTTRSFALIDQDQSDNVTAEYLANSTGQTAQDTAANQQSITGSSVLFNGSDNGLLDFFMDPALGCSPWKVPDLANSGAMVTALPLDELQAAKYAGASAADPAALVPLNDPMTTLNGSFSTTKTNLYRAGADMPPLPAGQTPQQYCTDMEQIQGARLQQDVNLLIGAPSPDPGTGSNLFTFVSARLQGSFDNLNCASFGLTNDVSTTVDDNGVAVAACFLNQVSPLTPGAGNPTAGETVCPASTGSTASPTPTGTVSPTASPSASPTATRRHHRRRWTSPPASTPPASTSPASIPSASTATPTPTPSP